MSEQASEELTQMKYSEWLASLIGACLIAVSLGVWLHEILDSLAWLILILGVALHSWGMFVTYRRNK
jgi:hypothetical protein